MDQTAQMPGVAADAFPVPEAPPPPWLANLLARYGSGRLLMPERPEHPILPFPQALAAQLLYQGGPEKFNEYVSRRNKRLRLELHDPLRWGFENVIWKMADVLWGWITWADFCADPDVPARWKVKAVLDLVMRGAFLHLFLGGNRASKTEYMCKRAVQCFVKHPGARIWLLHSNQANSVEYHHTNVYKFLPPEWRELGRGKVAYIVYTRKNGFTEDKLVGPQGQVIELKTYEQFQKDPKVFEGAELGAPSRETCVAAACDEEVPMRCLETLVPRSATRAGDVLAGFTPLEGYTDTVGTFLDGATDILREPVDGVLDARGNVVESPLLQAPVDTNRTITYFFSKFNPFGNYEQLLKLTAGDSMEKKLTRLAGKASKMREAQFPKFRDDIHLFDPGSEPTHGTRWLIVDPCGSRNWFMLWILVDIYKRFWVYREWPCPSILIPGIDGGYPGPWALPGAPGGVLGPGARGFGLSIANYKNEIARLEGWKDFEDGSKLVDDWDELNGARERIKCRLLDHRYCESPQQNARGNSNLLQECLKLKLRMLPGPAMNIDPGVQLINNRLAYEDRWLTDAPADRRIQDGPKLFISRTCTNLTFALKNWTRVGGSDEPTKDPIDCLRYAHQHPIFYADTPTDTERRYEARGYGVQQEEAA